MVSKSEIIEHQGFLHKCVIDYRSLAYKLIYRLAEELLISIDLDHPLNSFGFLKMQELDSKENRFDDWTYRAHGFHCNFKNIKTGQEIEVSLDTGSEFGAMEGYFFVRFLQSTPDYQPLPFELEEQNEFEDGNLILDSLVELGICKKIEGNSIGQSNIILADKEP